MKGTQLLGVVLLILGILALAYRGFSYTKEDHKASIGRVDISVEATERVNVPMWAGVIGIVAGGAFVLGRRLLLETGRPSSLESFMTADDELPVPAHFPSASTSSEAYRLLVLPSSTLASPLFLFPLVVALPVFSLHPWAQAERLASRSVDRALMSSACGNRGYSAYGSPVSAQ